MCAAVVVIKLMMAYQTFWLNSLSLILLTRVHDIFAAVSDVSMVTSPRQLEEINSAIKLLYNISNPTTRTGLDFQAAQFDPL